MQKKKKTINKREYSDQEIRQTAERYVEKGWSSEAMILLKEILRDNPNDAKTHYAIAKTYMFMNMPEKTLAALDQTIKLSPGFAYAHFMRGMTLKVLNRRTEEIEAYKTALKIDPDFAEAYHNLGVALKRSGDTAAADDALASSLQAWDNREKSDISKFDKGAVSGMLSSVKQYLSK